MKSALYSVFLILAIVSVSFGQTKQKTKPVWKKYRSDTTYLANDTIYQKGICGITICNTDFQAVHLVQRHDSSFFGDFVSIARVEKENTAEFNRYAKRITKTTALPEQKVHMLMDSLGILGIERLPDIKDIDGYVSGLDGVVYSYYIYSNQGSRSCSYWCPESDYYQNPSIKEVQQVRAILRLLERQLKLTEEFDLFKNELPKGKYYYGGVVMVKQ
jgi:hypothetical protein